MINRPSLLYGFLLAMIITAFFWATVSMVANYRLCGLGSLNTLVFLSIITLGAPIWFPSLAVILPVMAVSKFGSRGWTIVTLIVIGMTILTYTVESFAYQVPIEPRTCAIDF